MLWRQGGLASELSPSGARGPEVCSPAPVVIAWRDVPSQVLPALMFTGKTGSGNLKATSDRVTENNMLRADVHTDDKSPTDVSGAQALLATPPVPAGGSQVSRPAPPSSFKDQM